MSDGKDDDEKRPRAETREQPMAGSEATHEGVRSPETVRDVERNELGSRDQRGVREPPAAGDNAIAQDPYYLEPFGPGDREARIRNTELEEIRKHDGHSRAEVAAEMGWAAQDISRGHAFREHVHQFPEVQSEHDLQLLTQDIIERNEPRKLEHGRQAYWDDQTQAVVIIDPRSRDFGTIFRPRRGKAYFDGLE